MNNLIVFDLDGTLLYTIEDIKEALNYTLRKYNFREISTDEAMNLVGNGVNVLIERLLDLVAADRNLFDTFLFEYSTYYANHLYDFTKEYDGVTSTLNELKKKGYKLVVLSNKPNQDTINIINHYFPNLFDEVIGKGKFALKPDPEALLYLIEKYSALKTYMVGDSINDIEVAKRASAISIYASYGYQKLNHYDLKIDTFFELLNYL